MVVVVTTLDLNIIPASSSWHRNCWRQRSRAWSLSSCTATCSWLTRLYTTLGGGRLLHDNGRLVVTWQGLLLQETTPSCSTRELAQVIRHLLQAQTVVPEASLLHHGEVEEL